jgi:hypothetical protein
VVITTRSNLDNNERMVDVAQLTPEPEMLRNALMLACHAPSLHNSQPWHWVAESGRLDVHADPAPLVSATDRWRERNDPQFRQIPGSTAREGVRRWTRNGW